jgi:hypothetical protein
MKTNKKEAKIGKTDIKYRKFAEFYLFGGEHNGEKFEPLNATKSYLTVYDVGGKMDYYAAASSANRLLKNAKVIAIVREIEEQPLNYSIKKGEIIESNKEIRDKALKDRKYSDAIKANAEISRLMGFYEPDKVESSGVIKFEFDNFSLDDESSDEQEENIDE